MPDRAKLQSDDARADDQQTRRYLVERQRAGRRHDALFVDLDALEPGDVGAGGDHDISGLDGLGFAVAAGEFESAGAEHATGALDDVDLVLLHQKLDALDVAVNALL